MDIGEKLRRRRQELDITQGEVARFVGVAKSTVAKWEAGKIGSMATSRVARLAAVLQVSPLFMLDIENIKNVFRKNSIKGYS